MGQCVPAAWDAACSTEMVLSSLGPFNMFSFNKSKGMGPGGPMNRARRSISTCYVRMLNE